MIQKIVYKLQEELDNDIKTLSDNYNKCVFISTDPNSSPSYIKNKAKILDSYGIKHETVIIHQSNPKRALQELERLLITLNNSELCTSIIVQLPLREELKKHEKRILSKIKNNKDVDCLNNDGIPITSEVLYEIICEIPDIENKNVLFIGKGATTNRKAMTLMKTKYRMIDSTTTESYKNESIEWADLIISSTGRPSSLICENKMVISPTIGMADGKPSHDLMSSLSSKNDTHEVYGNIGKLTCLLLAKRIKERVSGM